MAGVKETRRASVGPLFVYTGHGWPTCHSCVTVRSAVFNSTLTSGWFWRSRLNRSGIMPRADSAVTGVVVCLMSTAKATSLGSRLAAAGPLAAS